MSILAKFRVADEAELIQMLDAAANPVLRQYLARTIEELESQLLDLQMPATLDGAPDFLVQYRRLRDERQHLQELLAGFEIVTDKFTSGE